MARFGDVWGSFMCGPKGMRIYKQCLVNIKNTIFKQDSAWVVLFCFLRLSHSSESRRCFQGRPVYLDVLCPCDREKGLFTIGAVCLSRT